MKIKKEQTLAFYLRPSLYNFKSYNDKAMVIIEKDTTTLKSEYYVLAEYDNKNTVVIKKDCEKKLEVRHLNDFLYQFGFKTQSRRDLKRGNLITKEI